MDVPIVSKWNREINYADSPDMAMALTLTSTTDLKPHLQHLMSRAISKEESARNIQRLLWCTVALLLQIERREYASLSSSFVLLAFMFRLLYFCL
jgi:hypothetical protein